MIALRLVIDTNILVSAALKPEGLQRTILILAITKPARLYVSEAILFEYREVLSRPELMIRKGIREHLLQLIKKHSQFVRPMRRLSYIKCEDIRSISKQRLQSRWGSVSGKTLARLDDRLRMLLTL